jgi:dihydroorotate dehydrogenase
MLKKFIISPPFGTYISHPNAMSVLGTYTPFPRPGKWGQVLKTLRYTKNGWVNAIGLRNSGVSSIRNFNLNKIYSFANPGYDCDWDIILTKVPTYTTIELNLSCPNLNSKLAINLNRLEMFAKRSGTTIVKVSPIDDISVIDAYFKAGIKFFHIANTLKTELGGLSGRAIHQYSLPMIFKVKQKYGKSVGIIGGGGIYTLEDYQKYVDVGADYFSIATGWFKPWNCIKLLDM